MNGVETQEAEESRTRLLLEIKVQLDSLVRRVEELERRNGINAPPSARLATTETTCYDGGEHLFPGTMGRRRLDDPPVHCQKCGRVKGT